MKLKYLTLAVIFLFCLLQNSYAESYQDRYREHTIAQGENVFSIAKKYNVTVEDIYRLNPTAEKGIRANERLLIPLAGTVQRTNTTATTSTQGEPYFLHSIGKKETLYSVSKHYGIPEKEILAANEGLTAKNFKIGYVIRIPKNPGSYIPKGIKTHTVVAKETLWSLAQKYNLTTEQIAEANPELKKSGLKKGMTVIIPSATSNNTQQKSNAATNEANLLYEMTSENNKGVIRIGLFLPFLDIDAAQKARFVEYYEGFLLAVEDVKKKGYSVDIYAFDIRKGRNTKKLQSLLDTYEIKSLNMIIGGVSDEEIAILSEFTKANDIEYTIPFPVRNNNIITNPYAFHSNVSPALLYPKVSDIFTTKFHDSNIIILEEEKSSENDKKDFVSELQKHFSKELMKSQTVIIRNNLHESLKTALSSDKKNVLVPASSSLATLSKIIPAIRSIKNQDVTIDISLFGYPDWQTYSVQFLDDFFKNDTYIFSSFYVDNTDVRTQQFIDRFQKWYGKGLLNTYPKYGILGYDTGLYFLTALSNGQGRMPGNISASLIPTIQSVFYFNNLGDKGNINTGLYFVHYKTNMTIEKLDYSK